MKSLCKRAILLDGGSIVKDGAPDSVLDYYNSVIARKKSDEEIHQVEGGRAVGFQLGLETEVPESGQLI